MEMSSTAVSGNADALAGDSDKWRAAPGISGSGPEMRPARRSRFEDFAAVTAQNANITELNNAPAARTVLAVPAAGAAPRSNFLEFSFLSFVYTNHLAGITEFRWRRKGICNCERLRLLSSRTISYQGQWPSGHRVPVYGRLLNNSYRTGTL